MNTWTTPSVWPFKIFEETLSTIAETLQNVDISMFIFCAVLSITGISTLTIFIYMFGMVPGRKQKDTKKRHKMSQKVEPMASGDAPLPLPTDSEDEKVQNTTSTSRLRRRRSSWSRDRGTDSPGRLTRLSAVLGDSSQGSDRSADEAEAGPRPRRRRRQH